MKSLLATKKGMTHIFKDGVRIPVTIVVAQNVSVTQVRTKAVDGYTAVQLATGTKKKFSKSEAGHAKKSGLEKTPKHLREFRTHTEGYEVGQKLDVSMFVPGDVVHVQAATKGRGFQGVVKRHRFKGAPATHGNKDQLRMPGSIGNTDPGHVFPGKRMAGRMGGSNVTVRNLEVVDVLPEENAILIKGAVPGPMGQVIAMYGPGRPPKKAEVAVEAPAVEATEAPAAAEPVTA